MIKNFVIDTIRNGNRTEWRPVWSVIIQVKTKLDHRAAVVQFVYHKYDYRPNWTRNLFEIFYFCTVI